MAAAAGQYAGAREIISRVLHEKPPGSPFSELQHTMCVLAAKLDAPHVPHEQFFKMLARMGEPREGVVIALNSNFGGRCQPGAETYVKKGGKVQPNVPAGRKQRQAEGIGGSLNSSVEPILRPPPDSEIGRALAAKGTSVLKLKYFPNTGSMQVSGTRLKRFADGIWAIHQWVAYLNRIRVFDRPVTLVDGSIGSEAVNFKFVLKRMSPRLVINFRAFAQHILNEFHAVQAREGPDATGRWPAKLWESTFKEPQANSQGSFKFVGRKKDKGPRVNLFVENGKVNFLGCPSYGYGEHVYREMCRLFSEHWQKFVSLSPLDDYTPVGAPCEILCASLLLLKTPIVPVKLPAGLDAYSNEELNTTLGAICSGEHIEDTAAKAAGEDADGATTIGGVVLDDYFSQFAE